ncbi:hypothetical protein D9613_003500 [Agrocybe pediades]|uniref:Uncharacterized protein n=1 Tax=Agrocybe pediades TaxID=84607 RepID=A0A8H4VMY2_9AGAR|nr:hypothetical protein D9613_003500 [Agrocybe pediades]
MSMRRLKSVVSHLVPHSKSSSSSEMAKLPTFDELPHFKNFPGCAWSVWGADDQLGTVNLLTEKVVQQAASEEIKSVSSLYSAKPVSALHTILTVTGGRLGRTVSLNWPINFPDKPMFNRKTPEVKMIMKRENGMPRDDEIHMNTQSGSQWDGMRHYGLIEHGVFYNKQVLFLF